MKKLIFNETGVPAVPKKRLGIIKARKMIVFFYSMGGGGCMDIRNLNNRKCITLPLIDFRPGSYHFSRTDAFGPESLLRNNLHL